MIELLEIEAGSAHYSREDGTAIDCRVKFSHMPDEFLPFTANSSDPMPHVQAVWAGLQGMDILPYVAPPVPIPAFCGPAQAKIILWEQGLLDQIETMVLSHPYKPVTLWYQNATVWERSHPYVTALAYEIGLTDETMDALFISAQAK